MSSFLQSIILVSVGGAFGASFRYVLYIVIHLYLPKTFPYGILFVNITGCFLISLVHFASDNAKMAEIFRLFLATGVLGGFTTYSTFNYDMLMAFSKGHFLSATLNLVSTLIGCLIGGFLGLELSKKLF